MKWLNTNTIHNILNLLLGVVGVATTILVALGCSANEVTGAVDCSQAPVGEGFLVFLVGAAGVVGMLKTVINLVRDGFGGLFKQQPPVATDVKTIVVTGDANSTTEVKTSAPGSTPVVM